eukprot:358855-Chlamydomonas_euryale.AAC.6
MANAERWKLISAIAPAVTQTTSSHGAMLGAPPPLPWSLIPGHATGVSVPASLATPAPTPPVVSTLCPAKSTAAVAPPLTPTSPCACVLSLCARPEAALEATASECAPPATVGSAPFCSSSGACGPASGSV